MSKAERYGLVGAIYLAPHVSSKLSLVVAMVMFLVAIALHWRDE